jgi:hypothetical protein
MIYKGIYLGGRLDDTSINYNVLTRHTEATAPFTNDDVTILDIFYNDSFTGNYMSYESVLSSGLTVTTNGLGPLNPTTRFDKNQMYDLTSNQGKWVLNPSLIGDGEVKLLWEQSL